MKSHELGKKAEKELVRYLKSADYCVMHAKASGASTQSPDLLAFYRGLQFAFEVKNNNKDKLYLSIPQFKAFEKWERTTGITCFVAWKRRRREWRFIPLSLFNRTKHKFSISWEIALKAGKILEEFEGVTNKL